MTDTLTIRRPDDWHAHLRDGALLQAVLPHTARDFGRAIVMPNLVPPVTTPELAEAYAGRVRAALPPGLDFTPLMTAYLTDDIRPDDLARGFHSGAWVAAKLYPANATTNSAHGVRSLDNIRGALGRMSDIGMPLLVHGEVTHDGVDIFDREAVFIRDVLTPLRAEYPALKIVLEHITTEQAVDFVGESEGVGATITAHHLMINRNAIFAGGVRPHFYCLPIAKRERHRLALRRAATSGDPRYFLGTDTAPHVRERKESACGCAGIYTAPIALACYAQVFDEEGALDKLEAFASLNGPAFYGMPPNDGEVTLERALTPIPDDVRVGDTSIHVFLGGEQLKWRVVR